MGNLLSPQSTEISNTRLYHQKSKSVLILFKFISACIHITIIICC
jgi:hypothetical protein